MSETDKNKDQPDKRKSRATTARGTPPSQKSGAPRKGAGEEEDVLFPKEQEPEAVKETLRPRTGFRWTNLILLFVLISGFYLLGHLTNPEQFENTKQTFKDMVAFSKERLLPYKDKMVDYIETQIERPETGEPLKSEGSGTTVQGLPVTQPEQPERLRKVKYWQAPMNPDYKSDKPGKSPMGMDLIPVYEDEDGGGQITINPRITQNIGVKTETVKKRKLTYEIRTNGRLTYDERRIHHVHTKYGGWIEELYVDFTGQRVEKGDEVMAIYSPELVSTQEEFLLALKYKESLKDNPFPEIREGAERLLASTRKRLELFDVPEHQIHDLIQTRQAKKALHIHSPMSGFVIKKNAEHGRYVESGTPLYMIADLSNVWVLADIYEYELPWVKLGQKAEMSLPYFPGKKFTGKVTYIDPFLDPETRTLKVRMDFKNPGLELKPDMYANVFLKSTIAKEGVAAPEEAVIRSGEKDMVIVQVDGGRFEPREVSLGVQAEGYYQVLKGLKAGETVVTSSGFLIDSESRLKEALNKLGTTQPEKTTGDAKQTQKKLELKLDENRDRHTH